MPFLGGPIRLVKVIGQQLSQHFQEDFWFHFGWFAFFSRVEYGFGLFDALNPCGFGFFLDLLDETFVYGA